jgi:organic radical activating enzyme
VSRRDNENWIDYRKRMLDPVSGSFCGAKWLDATIWLNTGSTASCHLPPAHRIDIAELAANPSAIHNTMRKKIARKQMLEGVRPSECDYCWRIEDMGRDNASDRLFKSSRYSEASLASAATAPWDADVGLETLEIAFNRTCNFACSYCNAGFSTTWGKDIAVNGPYQNMVSDGAGAFQHAGAWAEPYGKSNDGNPYVKAFWQWWPELSKTLKHLRVTGGEPLMATDVWDLFDWFEASDLDLEFAINSNLGAKSDLIDRLIAKSHRVRHLHIYTSNEAHGAQAEYIRDGLDYAQWVCNVERVLTEGNIELFNVMMTVNNLCLFSLTEMLDQIMVWKDRFGSHKVIWSVNILRFPSFQSPLVLPVEIKRERHAALSQWIADHHAHPHIRDIERESLQRLVDYLDVVRTPHPRADEMTRLEGDLRSFHEQYDERRGKSLAAAFPQVAAWLATVPATLLNHKQELIEGHAAD